ncbi:unnamed protein product [Ilex paraguariensis]|uniref:Uncharacterized protein n=1 Tax=Ilex paraguariensis TaxID=185542 RepID=A0ABC8U4F8_9AQUA
MGEGVLLWLVNRSKDSAINKVGRLKLAVQFLMIESVKHLATKITFFNSRKCFKDGALRFLGHVFFFLLMLRISSHDRSKKKPSSHFLPVRSFLLFYWHSSISTSSKPCVSFSLLFTGFITSQGLYCDQ